MKNFSITWLFSTLHFYHWLFTKASFIYITHFHVDFGVKKDQHQALLCPEKVYVRSNWWIAMNRPEGRKSDVKTKVNFFHKYFNFFTARNKYVGQMLHEKFWILVESSFSPNWFYDCCHDVVVCVNSENFLFLQNNMNCG